jgi:hypothetical protein
MKLNSTTLLNVKKRPTKSDEIENDKIQMKNMNLDKAKKRRLKLNSSDIDDDNSKQHNNDISNCQSLHDSNFITDHTNEMVLDEGNDIVSIKSSKKESFINLENTLDDTKPASISYNNPITNNEVHGKLFHCMIMTISLIINHNEY